MKLIFIYGPPAVGKLTIARELAKITPYKVFHNHIAQDYIESIIDFHDPQFFYYIEQLMLYGITIAAKEDTPIIFTYCYDYKQDNSFVKKVMKIVKKYYGTVYFVQVTCSDKQLFKRVTSLSRKKYGKIKSVKTLKTLFNKWNLNHAISFVKQLHINNTYLKPKKAAERIKQYYHL